MRPSYWTGRRPVTVIAVWLGYMTVGLGLWRQQIVTEPVTGGVLRAFAVPELVAIVAAPIAVHALSARMPVIDLTSPRRLERRAGAAAGALVAGFALLPVAILAAVRASPGLLPTGTLADLSTEDRPLAQIYLPAMAATIAASIALTVALALVSTSLVGTVAGPVLFLALTVLLTFAQATPGSIRIDLGGAGDPPYQPHALGLLLAILTVTAGISAWARTRAAATPALATLVRRLGARFRGAR